MMRKAKLFLRNYSPVIPAKAGIQFLGIESSLYLPIIKWFH